LRELFAEDSNAIVLMAASTEVKVHPPVDGSILRFLHTTTGTATVTLLDAKLVSNAIDYTRLTSTTRDASLMLMFDSVANRWRMLHNEGWVAA